MPQQPFKTAQQWIGRLVSAGMIVGWSALHGLPALSQSLSEKIVAMEQGLEQEFESYFGEDLADVTQTPEDIAQTLSRIAAETGTKPAVLWAIPRGDHLHLVLLTPGGTPIVRDLYDVPDDELQRVVNNFMLEASSVAPLRSRPAAEKLHQWIIEPFESEFLVAEEIDTILFCLGKGLRTIPISALHDGSQFLIEKYSLTRIPAFNLIQTDYARVRQGRILAMGASEFQEQSPLPAVPTELSNILWELSFSRPRDERWVGRSLLNQDFTRANLEQHIRQDSPNIVHLATHAFFQAGNPDNSYIQFWDDRLQLNDIQQVEWNTPSLDLLVLSACRTAIGNDEAELGFAGLALQSGVRSVLASLWNVSDTGTLALMSEFYRQIDSAPTKAEALRQAQIKMLRGEVRYENEQLQLSRGRLPLPDELTTIAPHDLSSPYYWAGFTLISSPW
ncbi:CHAT domain-containing protein [Leptolyngbya sp. AN02str]|uniref:CHAT domain-containing protein n=1 Tax=Leptolyngbya sp. AN02str TaxID=3423363 RepID=UPI003D314BF0